MGSEPDQTDELTLIRTCLVATTEHDMLARFVIDGRRYRDPTQVRRLYDEASDEMNQRVACEWETHRASPTEPPSSLPSWEQFRTLLDKEFPVR